eukprot:IDg7641t1
MHRYQYKFVLSSTHYDVLLGTPWHADTKTVADYEKQTAEVDGMNMKGKKVNCKEYRVTNINRKAFKKLSLNALKLALISAPVLV